ncbi:MAG: histidinol phosphate phosphatase domain-containing protein [Candidatus Omnitrophica bacterium]|nr:histidinol phosphate phosphatase domain-containing protein [Candidatus Omnitrophota bacterium]
MIDLHTHSLLSDGDLLPSELVRRAQVAGYRAIAITDHVDHSNIEEVIRGTKKVSEVLNKYWDILVLPGVEITHVPVEVFPELVKFARKKGVKIVVGHGESPVEPVLPGTNAAAIKAGVDILAHPGNITEEDARLAQEKGVYLELTCRGGHSNTNKHVFDTATNTNTKLILNTDAHSPQDLLTIDKREEILSSLTDSEEIKNTIIRNSEEIVEKL